MYIFGGVLNGKTIEKPSGTCGNCNKIKNKYREGLAETAIQRKIRLIGGEDPYELAPSSREDGWVRETQACVWYNPQLATL